MTEAYETLIVTRPQPHLLEVTLNRPAARNALNTRMGRELGAIFRPLVFDPGEHRAIVLSGAGDRAFCAGADLKERDGMDDAQWRAQHAVFEEAVYAIIDCPVPVIAAVNGAAFGGGFEIALACDFVYATPEARFAFPEVTLGIMPGVGGTQNLGRAVGERRAKEIVLSGRPLTAAEGVAWGLVNRLIEAPALRAEALAMAAAIAANAPIAVRQAKQAIHRGLQMDLHNAIAFELQAYNRMVETQDRREGIRAFNEKRKPNFTGR